MIRGKRLFKCDNCKKVFVGLDIEYRASTLSQPVSCPNCKSNHTRPLFSSKGIYKKVWEAPDQNTQP